MSPRAFEQAYGSLRRGGTLVFVALPADNEVTLPIFETVLNGITIVGSIVGTRIDLREVFELHGAGRTTVIRETRPLDDVNEAMADLEAGRSPPESSSSPDPGEQLMTTIEQVPSAIVDPATAGIKARYENFIGGEWVAPTTGEYRDNLTPATGEAFTQVAFGRVPTSSWHRRRARCQGRVGRGVDDRAPQGCSTRVADAIEETLETLAIAEAYDNGKPIRETRAADIPLAADHFRYFASVIRGEEGRISRDR